MATTYTPALATNGWLQRHPVLNWIVSHVARLIMYIFSLQWIVDFTRWLQLKGGLIAESAFTLATTYVILDLVAHPLVSWLISDNVIATCNQIALICFSVLPELIAVAAILKTIELWGMFIRTKDKSLLFWPVAYTLLTSIFVTATLLTITGFSSSVEAMNNGSTSVIYHISGTSVVVRCLTGWIFGTVELIHAKIGTAQFTRLFDALRSQVVAQQNIVTEKESAIATLQGDIDRLQSEMTNTIAALKSDIALREQELTDARFALATKQIARRKSDNRHGPEYNATDNGESITVVGNGLTVVATGEKRARLKENLQAAILRGDKINLKKISAETGVSYGTARKYANVLIEEITTEHPSVPRIALVREA